jgi:hypothetical protein
MGGLDVAISYGPLNPQLFGQWNFAEPMSSGGIERWHDEHAPVDIELLTTIPLVQ